MNLPQHIESIIISIDFTLRNLGQISAPILKSLYRWVECGCGTRVSPRLQYGRERTLTLFHVFAINHNAPSAAPAA
jgi:hypothetical protein